LRIVDFGIFGSTSGINPEKVKAGSLKYMSPELLTGHFESSPAIDVWSLGIILHGLVLGVVPFKSSKSSNKEELKKMIIESDVKLTSEHVKISASCKDLIRKMLCKNPTKRIPISEIMTHPWIAKYKEKKERIEWGYSESESDDSLAIENESEAGKSESTKVET
jgi:serine/threonine protein kinase